MPARHPQTRRRQPGRGEQAWSLPSSSCLSSAPGAGRFAGSSGAPPPCPPRTPWAPAAAASWMLPDSALGRPQGPPLWDPACCCPRVSVFSWGGSVPPRPSICDRSTLSGSGGRRRGGQGRPQVLRLRAMLSQVERNRDSAPSAARSLSLAGAWGEARAGLQGPAWSWSCRQSLPDSPAIWGPVPPQVLPGRSVLALLSPNLPGAPDPLPEGTGQCVALESPPAET